MFRTKERTSWVRGCHQNLHRGFGSSRDPQQWSPTRWAMKLNYYDLLPLAKAWELRQQCPLWWKHWVGLFLPSLPGHRILVLLVMTPPRGLRCCEIGTQPPPCCEVLPSRSSTWCGTYVHMFTLAWLYTGGLFAFDVAVWVARLASRIMGVSDLCVWLSAPRVRSCRVSHSHWIVMGLPARQYVKRSSQNVFQISAEYQQFYGSSCSKSVHKRVPKQKFIKHESSFKKLLAMPHFCCRNMSKCVWPPKPLGHTKTS